MNMACQVLRCSCCIDRADAIAVESVLAGGLGLTDDVQDF